MFYAHNLHLLFIMKTIWILDFNFCS